jgi:hypothetical protein
MFGILGAGFLLGMQHALAADHIAAVSSIAAPHPHRRHHQHGLTWGLGHTLALSVFAGIAIRLGHAMPDDVASTGVCRARSALSRSRSGSDGGTDRSCVTADRAGPAVNPS